MAGILRAAQRKEYENDLTHPSGERSFLIPIVASLDLGGKRKLEVYQMTDQLKAAIEVLEQQIADKRREISDLERSINTLRRAMGLDPLYESTDKDQSAAVRGPRPDEYFRLPAATAVERYIEHRGHACSQDEILEALKAGGFDFEGAGWKPKDRRRSLAITLSKNPRFVKLPNGTIGLASMYPELKKGNRSAASKNDQVRDGEVNEGTNGFEADGKDGPRTGLDEEVNAT